MPPANSTADIATFDDSGSTSSGLLARVKGGQSDAWQRLAEIYGPLIYRWSRKAGLASEDAADVVQEVLHTVSLRLAEFQHTGAGAFRAWLWSITRHKIGDCLRRLRDQPQAQGGTQAQEAIRQVADPEAGSTTDGSAAENLGVVHRTAELVRAEFEDRTWQAFWRIVIDGHSPAHVAEDLGMTLHAVYKAKSRVLSRLRQELDGSAEC
jgi:RNA polymerase sigma-70 factor (ECF subfamily)